MQQHRKKHHTEWNNNLGCFSSILGMNLFGCKFCKGKCIGGGDDDKDRKNFDSLLWALVTVFQVLFLFCLLLALSLVFLLGTMFKRLC